MKENGTDDPPFLTDLVEQDALVGGGEKLPIFEGDAGRTRPVVMASKLNHDSVATCCQQQSRAYVAMAEMITQPPRWFERELASQPCDRSAQNTKRRTLFPHVVEQRSPNEICSLRCLRCYLESASVSMPLVGYSLCPEQGRHIL